MPGMTTPTLLTEALRREGVADARTDALTIGMYATDAGIYRVPPRAVVFPRHTDEIAATLSVARELGVPVADGKGCDQDLTIRVDIASTRQALEFGLDRLGDITKLGEVLTEDIDGNRRGRA